jgi:hypothetical protein
MNKKKTKVRGGAVEDHGIAIFVTVAAIAVLIILIILPAPKPVIADLEEIDIEDLNDNHPVIVENKYVKFGTNVYKKNKHTGDLKYYKSQDLPATVLILTIRRHTTGIRHRVTTETPARHPDDRTNYGRNYKKKCEDLEYAISV